MPPLEGVPEPQGIRREILLVNIPTRRYVIGMAVQERSTATQARIVSAARTLFLGRNFADVTMEQVASSAEATKGSPASLMSRSTASGKESSPILR